MPKFPHNTKSTAAVQRYEPAVGSNFNAFFVIMGDLVELIDGEDYNDLTEYVKNVSGLFIEYAGNTIEGGFKTTKFRYDSNEKQTYYDIEVGFHNFLDNDHKQFIYNKLVRWSRVKYNPMTGEKTLKRIYADASIVVEKFNRDGSVYWKRVAHNVFPMNDFPDQVSDYSSHDMNELSVTFNADWVTDVTNDIRLLPVNHGVNPGI